MNQTNRRAFLSPSVVKILVLVAAFGMIGPFLAPAFSADSTSQPATQRTKPVQKVSGIREATIDVSGMDCGNCVKSVTVALRKMKGVISVKVTLKPGQAVVSYHTNQTNVAALMSAIKKAGYSPTLRSVAAIQTKKAIINVKGMHCGSCVYKLTQAFQKAKGVMGVKVTLRPQQVKVVYAPTRTNTTELAQVVKKAGYQVIKQQKKATTQKSK